MSAENNHNELFFSQGKLFLLNFGFGLFYGLYGFWVFGVSSME